MSSAKEQNAAESFVGSVFKYSVSTFVNIAIMGTAMLLTGLFILPDVLSQIALFTNWTNTIMTVAILGLDQSLIRFYFEPPEGLSKNGLFRACFAFSGGAVLLAGAVGSTLLLGQVYSGIGFSGVGQWVVPLLFLNAFFYMVARYFNVLYRMEGNIRTYTVESILMQFFYRLFYILGNFLPGGNPVAAMVICSVLGLGVFAFVFSFLRRDVLRPRRRDFSRPAYGIILPYGLAVAPTSVMVTLNFSLSQTLLLRITDTFSTGVYVYAYGLSNIVSMVQLGFASFWGPYMFANYKTQQDRIKRVHNYLNVGVLCFFTLLVAFQDIIFLILPGYAVVKYIFPIMMLSAVFNILCETTVYGNAIARRPIFDTIGIGVGLVANVGLVLALTPLFGLYGAAAALAAANFAMFLFRTITAQKLYSSMESPAQTAVAVLLAVGAAITGTLFADAFVPKLLCSLGWCLALCLWYRREVVRLVQLGLSMAQKLFVKKT